MKRQALLLSLALFAGTAWASAQNLIFNPGFEDGAIPTTENQVSLATGWNNDCGKLPDLSGSSGKPILFDRRSPHCHIQIPSNLWGNRDTRSGGNRYTGFSGSDTQGFYFSTVKGTLSGPLAAGCNYQVSFWASAIDGGKSGGLGASCTTPLQETIPNPDQRIEVVLRKGSDCSNGKVVFQSPPVTQKAWIHFAGQFSLTAADAAAGYDRIEFRLSVVSVTPPNGTAYSHTVYLDDVSLTSALPIDPDFQLTGTIPAGNANVFFVRADVANIPTGSSFWWNVEEVDRQTGAVVPGTTLTNPPAWWNTPYSTTFPGYNNTSPNGSFTQGHTYRIRRGAWSQCNPWSEITKTISMCTGANCL